jgi:hypothetical protein
MKPLAKQVRTTVNRIATINEPRVEPIIPKGQRGQYIEPPFLPIPKINPPLIQVIDTRARKIIRGKRIRKDDLRAAQLLVLEYFQNHHELCVGRINHERSEAFRQLSSTLNIPIEYPRKWFIDAEYAPTKKVIYDGSQYKFVHDNLVDLVNRYNLLRCHEWVKAKKLGISGYQLNIMFYLAGAQDRVSRQDLPHIIKKVNQLRDKGILPIPDSRQPAVKVENSRVLIPDDRASRIDSVAIA